MVNLVATVTVVKPVTNIVTNTHICSCKLPGVLSSVLTPCTISVCVCVCVCVDKF